MDYLRSSFTMLRDPAFSSTIPFHRQAFPIPDPQQQHIVARERQVVNSTYNTPNDLPKDRFLGTFWSQHNQPHFLGANERIAFERFW